MKFTLLFFSLFQFTFAFRQWNLIAIQPVTSDQLAIDSCGNAFARVANRVYRSTDLGQNWEQVLELPSILNPSVLMVGNRGTVSITVYSTKSGVLHDYQFACDGNPWSIQD